MFTNIYYDTRNSTVHLWERDEDGNRHYHHKNWVPYVFIPDENGETQTINRLPVTKKTFNNYKSYQNFQENTKAYENRCVPSIQYLAEKYHYIPNDDIPDPDLSIYSVDIEVDAPIMPKPEDAKYPIVLISVHSYSTDKITTFGIGEYTGTSDADYKKCDTEKELINDFFKWWHKHYPDVITGWNIAANNKTNRNGGFDLPYIINRSINLFGEKNSQHNLLSPIKIVKFFKQKDSDAYFISIPGISVLDYLSIYKWYTGKNLPNYKLETVAQEELEEGKLDYGDISLHELYRTDWNTYVDYNIQDARVVGELESKLGYIKLAQRISLLCRCPMEKYSITTQLVEGLLLSYYRSYGYCAPIFYGGGQSSYPAAYVKDPEPDIHYWLGSVDISSSYPSHIITLQMCISTYIGKITDLSEDKVIESTVNANFPQFTMNNFYSGKDTTFEGEKLERFNTMISRKLITISPCGTCFENKTGIISHVEKDIFLKRSELKKEMKKERDKNRKVKLDTTQKSLKTLINGLYGCFAAVDYSRIGNPHIAEAIASCGRHTIKRGEYYANELLNNYEQSTELKNILNELEEGK